jgi:hypothetical protein
VRARELSAGCCDPSRVVGGSSQATTLLRPSVHDALSESTNASLEVIAFGDHEQKPRSRRGPSDYPGEAILNPKNLAAQTPLLHASRARVGFGFVDDDAMIEIANS